MTFTLRGPDVGGLLPGLLHLHVGPRVADRYGTTAYATIAGRLTAPFTTAKAVAPLLAATLLAHGGYHLLLAAVTHACLLAAAGMHSMGSRSGRDERDGKRS
ncbi:hypothetical protein [Micromonospora sp. NPDC050495]|uniref:hypothetical protein n=1 Tax=Micromonospora sp. NPDC050495 TaxID=3154936 RepID=UPI0033EC31EC